MKELEKRLKKLEHLQNTIDSLVLFSTGARDSSVFYLTGSPVDGIAVYDFDKVVLFTSRMEASRARDSWVEVREIKGVKDVFAELNGRLGINASKLPAKVFRKIQSSFRYKDVSGDLENARKIKTKHEIRLIRKACKISENVYKRVLQSDTTGMSELEMKGMAEYCIHKECAVPAFETIVATGENIKYPHHLPTGKKLGKTVLVDFGVRFRGYCSDVTRTTGSEYEPLIDEAIKASFDAVRPGVRASDVFAAASDALGNKSKHFITSLGHGIGLDVHEAPKLSPKSSEILEPGMTLTIEPGIYVKNGIRKEHTVLVTESGLENLTQF